MSNFSHHPSAAQCSIVNFEFGSEPGTQFKIWALKFKIACVRDAECGTAPPHSALMVNVSSSGEARYPTGFTSI
jgi:hypothetical protein